MSETIKVIHDFSITDEINLSDVSNGINFFKL